MLFSSIPFLFYFLPCVFVLYFLVPMRWKNTVLLLASLFFYAWGEPKFVVFMLASIVQGYVLARLVEKYRADRRRAKLFLTLSLVFSLGLLGYCKYADFFLSGFNALTGLHIPLLRVALPIGISFYTFQILSYVVDVYRGDVKAQRNFIDLAAYVAMFPQLIAAPSCATRTLPLSWSIAPIPSWTSPPARGASYWGWAKRSCWRTSFTSLSRRSRRAATAPCSFTGSTPSPAC